jgi:hypothetical protein
VNKLRRESQEGVDEDDDLTPRFLTSIKSQPSPSLFLESLADLIFYAPHFI